ncbi:MAG: hypothetical protein K8J08_19320, partial [Thermoanaerobaculia bacterium]|nr:hypothetical protein [Thermoanaerobaculia bacterium]
MRSARHFLCFTLLGAAVALAPALAGGPGTLKFDQDTQFVGEASTQTIVVVERSQGEDGAVSVDYSVTGGTASAGSDYVTVSGTLNWSDGDESNRTIVVELLPDDISEPNETIELALSNPTNGATIR